MNKLIEVAVSHGLLRGRVVKSKLGYEYFSFQGIPYATPPVGILRFKPPQPVEKWTGTKDALIEGNRAPHFDMVKKDFCGDEDCLFLNVYTPKNIDKSSLKAVMVWIHGGGFAFGHADTEVYGPDFLVQHDIILVTMNYRLGVLGFLNLEIPEAPGNVGLKDQVEAMKWVKNEISNFGGDPNNITLFGESAGGSSVHFHMISDMSKGLFTKAIAQSGVALNNWAFTESHLDRAFKLSQALGFYTDNKETLLKFLHDVPPLMFAQKQDSVMTHEHHLQGIDQAFVPSIENKHLGNVFLSDSPRNLIKSGKLHDIPFITGITAHEGITEIGAILKHSWFLQELNEKFECAVLDMKDIVSGVDVNSIKSKMKEFYFNNKRISLRETLNGIIDLYSDINAVIPMCEAIALHKTHVSSPLYCYRFCYDGPFGWYKRYIVKHRQMDWTPSGVSHCDELGYIFTNEVLGPQTIVPGSDEMKVVNNITSLWANFAKTDNPSDDWLPVTSNSIETLDIGLTLKMNDSLEKPRIDFWKQIYSSLTF